MSPSVPTTAEEGAPDAPAEGGSVGTIAVIGLAAAALAVLARRPAWRRMPPLPLGRLPRDAAIGLVAMMVFMLAGSIGALAMGAALPADLAEAPYGRLARGVAMNLAQLAAAILLIRSTLFEKRDAPASGIPRAAVEGLVAAFLVFPLVAAIALGVNEATVLLGGPRAPSASHETLAILQREQDPVLALLTLAQVAVLVPLAEEAGWRGLMQPTVRTLLRPLGACALTAGLFASIHWSVIPPEGRPVGLSMLLVLGLALGVLRERTGGIVAPAVLHGAFNAMNVALALA